MGFHRRFFLRRKVCAAALGLCSLLALVSQTPEATAQLLKGSAPRTLAAEASDGSYILSGGLEVPATDDRTFRTYTLPNELQVVLVSDPKASKSGAGMNVHVGSMADPVDVPGMAHFLEHMLFMGTEKYPDEDEYAQFLATHGGYSNAYTADEFTHYFFEVDPDHLVNAMDRFAQFFISPLFNASSVSREMLAVDSEYRRNIQNDYWRMSRAFYDSSIRPDHPQSKFNVGSNETLSQTDILDKLRSFYNNHYSANLMKLVVVGKESLDELERAVETSFSAVKDSGLTRPVYEADPITKEQMGQELLVETVLELRQMDIRWSIPAVDYQRSSSIRLLNYFLGDMREGSILFQLKSNNLAENSLTAALELDNRDYAVLVISIDLTEDGLKNKDMVVSTVFEYIGRLAQASDASLQKQFNEYAAMQSTVFRFKEKSSDLFSFTADIGTNMQQMPVRYSYSHATRLRDFSLDAFRSTVSMLTPANMVLSVSAKTHPVPLDRQEKWYGVKYALLPLTSSRLDVWGAALASPSSTMQLPPSNEAFIATDFSILPASTASEDVPKAIRKDDVMNVFLKQDVYYKKPLAGVVISMRGGSADETAADAAFIQLIVAIFSDRLTSTLGAARAAGLDFYLLEGTASLGLVVEGYNQVVPALLRQILTILKTTKLSEKMFKRNLDIALRSLRNNNKYPIILGFLYDEYMTDKTSYFGKDLEEAMESLQLEQVQARLEKFLSNLFCDILVNGNMNEAQALATADDVHDILGYKALPEDQRQTRVALTQLPKRKKVVFQTTGLDPENLNSVTVVQYQLGSGLTGSSKAELLAALVEQPFFDTLRTKEQLGYALSCWSVDWVKINSLQCFVEGSNNDSLYLEQRIESFFDNFIAEGGFDQFESTLESLIARKERKADSLSDNTWQYLSEITSGTYRFDLQHEQAKYLRTVTKSEMMDFFDQYISRNGSDVARLTVLVNAPRFPIVAPPLRDDVQVVSSPEEVRALPALP